MAHRLFTASPLARYTSLFLIISFWADELHNKTLFSWLGSHLFFQEVFLSHLIATLTPFQVPGLNACVLYIWIIGLALLA